MIKIREITKSYGDISVLRNLSLNIEKGSIYGIAGKSGAGKSTLLRCINGLEIHDEGSITIDGIDIKRLSPMDMRILRKNVGMIFQHFSLLERLTVYDNIALPLKCWKYKHGIIDKKVRELLDVAGIYEKIHKKPRELSGGQKQRVAIARALAMEPGVLLCDEATSALDPGTAKSIVDLLKKINEEMEITIVFVTHQIPVIRDLCMDMAIIDHGKSQFQELLMKYSTTGI
jgi:D-methionine transport system ATP-binding protein